MAYLFKLSSRLIVEGHLPTIASDAYGIRFVEALKTIALYTKKTSDSRIKTMPLSS
jgi:hypothetical protein